MLSPEEGSATEILLKMERDAPTNVHQEELLQVAYVPLWRLNTNTLPALAYSRARALKTFTNSSNVYLHGELVQVKLGRHGSGLPLALLDRFRIPLSLVLRCFIVGVVVIRGVLMLGWRRVVG